MKNILYIVKIALYILEKLVYTIKLPYTSHGMKAVRNMEIIKRKSNDCTGNRKLVLQPLRLTVVTW